MTKFKTTRRQMWSARWRPPAWRACRGGHRAAVDKVNVGVFPISSSLPYFVAIDLGYFKELNIEPQTIKLMGGPPNVAALMTNQIEVGRRDGDAGGSQRRREEAGRGDVHRHARQNKHFVMEQFVVREELADKVKTLKDFKGLKLMSAPGPANLNTAKGILAKVGLKPGDYTIDQLGMGQHVNAMKSGTFDGGYTLEPSATIMHKLEHRQDRRGRRDRQIRPRRSDGRRLRGRLRAHHRLHQQAARRRQALCRRAGPRRSSTSRPTARPRKNTSPRTR